MTARENLLGLYRRQGYTDRITASYAKIEDAYRHREGDVVPFQVADVNYFLSGETPALIPDDYFTDCESMLQYQVKKIERHMATYEDDYIPFLFPWYGTGVIPSALGAKILFQPKMDPAVQGVVVTSPEQLRQLSLPDPHRDGLMPRVLETIRYFREHSDLPISFTDPQGPLTTALTLTGPATLFIWLYEYPRAVHELMEFCTEAFIRWIKAQKQEIGPERSRCCFPHGIILPEQFGKVWLCDDDCVAISPGQYREFVAPYNARIFREFGGGTLHFCGSAEHQIENLAANPKADAMAGTASYSARKKKLDPSEVARLKRMAYRCDWDAAFDWPYFGMFLPPMPDADTCWKTSGHDTTGNCDPRRVTQMSWRKMNEKAKGRKEDGFYTLAYFNVTEFGSQIKGPEAARTNLPEADLWRDANAYLYGKLADGICRDENGKPIGSWSGSLAMDSGGPAYQRFLIEQADRHAEQLPDYDGIAIDRMDWLTRINFAAGADDNVGWYGKGRPGRFVGLSWIDTLAKIGPVMHRHGKAIFVNCCLVSHRLEYMREVDGFYDEYGDLGYALNGSSLLALRKPALMWTHSADSLKPDPDAYFQRHLHMGAYPTAPFPGNDHTVVPDPKVDPYYLDYGPMLDAIRGKKWMLQPHCVETSTPGVKVNLFEVPEGFALPVTFGGKAESAVVRIRNIPKLAELECKALQPGKEAASPVKTTFQEGVLELTVPLLRGCAMVQLRERSQK